MNPTLLKSGVLSLALGVFTSACSRTAEHGRSYALNPGRPQFKIAPADLARPAVLRTNTPPSGGYAAITVQLQLTAVRTEALRKFTQEHLRQQTQWVVGSRVLAEPFIVTEVSDGRADLAFSSYDEARAARDVLNRR